MFKKGLWITRIAEKLLMFGLLYCNIYYLQYLIIRNIILPPWFFGNTSHDVT